MILTYGAAAVIIQTLTRILFRIKIVGHQHIPKTGGFILASNHISYYDPPLMGSFAWREMHFMAKKELFRNRIFGALISHLNAHPINRNGFDKSAIDTVVALLKKGKNVVIFPEGTRAKGVDFLPARPGIAMIAQASGVPVVPAFISGSNHLKACFFGKMRMSIIFGPPMTADEIAAFSKDKEGYRRLADEILNRIRILKEDYMKSQLGH
jgi:1-acyl-sn-glycerol-3-phosphate acyltransferase